MVHVEPIGSNWRQARVIADLSSAEAASCLRLTQKSLLNIETNQERAVVSERLARRAARFYHVPLEDLVVIEGGGSGEGVPDEPPAKEQERERNTGPGRDGSGGTGSGKGGKSGPKRVQGAAA